MIARVIVGPRLILAPIDLFVDVLGALSFCKPGSNGFEDRGQKCTLALKRVGRSVCASRK